MSRNKVVVAVTTEEGGNFIPWPVWQERAVRERFGNKVFAIVFEDGAIWDPIAGWRGVLDNVS